MVETLCGKREWLKYLAITTMFLDHTGEVLLPDYMWLRYVGRLAFPLYAYLIATGYDLTRDRNKYLLRLCLLAGLSQLGFALYHPWWQLNVIFTFCLAVAALRCWEISHKGRIAAIIIACFTIGVSWFSLNLIEWGFIGFLTVISLRIMKRRMMVGAVMYAILMTAPWLLWALLLGASCWYQPLALLALPIIWWSPSNFKYRINPYIWRLFYPLHWFLLGLVNLSLCAGQGHLRAWY